MIFILFHFIDTGQDFGTIHDRVSVCFMYLAAILQGLTDLVAWQQVT